MEETSFKVEKLTAENYHTWKFNIKMFLIGKDLWDVVKGTEVLSDEVCDDERRKYKKRENLSLSIICLSVSTSLQIYVRNANTGKEAWENLANHFEEKTLSKKIFYRRKLYSARMEAGTTMVTHVNYVKTIAEHLEALDDEVVDKDLVMILISSLPDEYNNLITAMETLKEDKLTWTYVRDRVVHEYERKKGDGKHKKESQPSALFTADKRNQYTRKEYDKSKRNTKNTFKCHYCHEKGHFQRECLKKKSDMKKKEESASYCEQRKGECSFSPEFALQVGGSDVSELEWWLDSGCSQHMTWCKQDFIRYEEFRTPVDVVLADKSIVPGVGSGDVNIILFNNNEEVPVVFKNVLFVPKLKKRLISISEITKNNAEVKFKGDLCTLIINQKKYVIGHKHGKLWKLNNVATCCFGCANMKPLLLSLWHLRFGHLNYNDLKLLSEKKMVNGLLLNSDDKAEESCHGCAMGKQKRLPFPKISECKTNQQLEYIHSDVCGQMNKASVGGSLYFVTFIDDYSRYVYVYMLKHKSDVFEKFVEFVEMSENLTGKRVKKIRSDNGEYISNKFINFCKARGILRDTTIPYTPQQNGVSERMNRTLVEMARSMIHHADLPLNLWAEAVSTAAYLRNRSPTSRFKGVTPYERWFEVKPDVEHLRVFGCEVYVHIPDEKRRKLDKKAFKGVFIGYPEGSKGYKIYNPATHKMISSRDVTFLENTFKNKLTNKEQKDEQEYFFCINNPESEDEIDVELSTGEENENPVVDVEIFINEGNEISVVELPADEENEDSADDESSGENEGNDKTVVEEQVVQRVQRRRKEPNRYGEWANLVEIDAEPKTYKQAIKGPHAERWKEAMQEEYMSLKKHHTWDLVDLPKGRNLVGCKWVFKAKRRANGNIDRFKARLVAQGYSQEAGVDYDEVFAPVARYKSIRCVLAIATQLNLEVHQMDVKSAFLNGDLEDEIFMKQPEGFADEVNSNKVCRLNKSLYGLKQSARCWNLIIDNYLKSSQYVQSTADQCVYYLLTEGVDAKQALMIIAVYVDDTILCSNDIDVLKAEKKHLSNRFEMDDRGEVHFILGMEITRDRKKKVMTIDQKSYLQNVVKRFGMEDSKPVSTPIEPGMKFVKLNDDEEPVDVTLYQAAIGSLNYAAIATRPDISVAVGMLSQFMRNPGKEHWVGVKRILRYLRGTLSYGLKFIYSDDFELHGYADADWAGCLESRKSTSGHIFQIGECTIAWRSKKQPVVALSSTEAEYVALCGAAQEAVWLRNLLNGVGFEQPRATKLLEDNQGAIALSRNPKNHPRTKHIDVKYHYIRETVEKKLIELSYCPTGDMLADVLTKGLPRVSFEKFRLLMGVQSVSDVFRK